MKLYSKILTLALFATVSFSSCVKSKDEQLAVTKENLAGTYTLTSIKGKEPGLAEQDITSIYYPENCQRDDEFVLKANLDFDYIDAGSTCNYGGSFSDTWSLLNKDVYFDEIAGTVIKLTSTELVVKYTDGDSYVTFYLVRKL
jgi:hypothetical protein